MKGYFFIYNPCAYPEKHHIDFNLILDEGKSIISFIAFYNHKVKVWSCTFRCDVVHNYEFLNHTGSIFETGIKPKQTYYKPFDIDSIDSLRISLLNSKVRDVEKLITSLNLFLLDK